VIEYNNSCVDGAKYVLKVCSRQSMVSISSVDTPFQRTE